MKQSIRKPLALILAMCMIFGLLPVSALGAGGELAPAAGWTIGNENENCVIVDETTIRISTENGDFADDGSNVPRNYWIMDAPEGDYTLTAKVSGGLNASYQKAGVMVYLDDTTVASSVRRYHGNLGGNIFGVFQYQSWSNSVWGETAVADSAPADAAWVKLVKEGNTFTGYHSYDGEEWISSGNSITNDLMTDDSQLKIGVFAVNGSQEDSVDVTISDFAVDGTVIPFSGTSEGDVEPTGIRLDKSNLTLRVNESAQLTATLVPSYATGGITWESSDQAVATVEGGKVTAVGAGTATITASCGEFSAACSVAVSGEVPEGDVQYLCDEPWYEDNLITSMVGWGSLGVHSGVISPSGTVDGTNYVNIAGKKYDHGFTAHAESKLVFDIENMGVKHFLATVGINGTHRTKATAGFTVMADDTVLFDVEKVANLESVDISVSVPEGAKRLTLITDNCDGSNDSDHTTWADARVIVEKGGVILRRAELKAADFMWLDESIEAAVSGTMTDGSAADLTDAEVTLTSANEAVVAVEGMTLTAKGTGTAEVTLTVTLDGVTRTVTRFITVGEKGGDSAWQLTSPDGNTTVTLALAGRNELHYSATKDGTVIVEDSVVGLDTDLGDFSSGLAFVSAEEESVTEEYDLVSGKVSHVENAFNQIKLTFAKGEAMYIVEFRAFDDGYAFRSSVEKADGSEGKLQVYDEPASFDFPANTTIWAMPTGSSGYFNHENTYSDMAIESLSGTYALPLLTLSGDGMWTMLTEANLYDDAYIGSYVEHVGDGELELAFTHHQASQLGLTYVDTVYPFSTPWRLAVAGSLEEIVETTMVTDVSDDPYNGEEDWSWVETGFTSWTWLVGYHAIQYDYEAIKKFVDFSGEMGWKYYIMDEGWQPYAPAGTTGKRYDGYFEWFDELVEFAEERDVKLIAWILAHDLDTPEEREVLKEYAEKGIAGIKVDFFDYDDQDTTQLYQDIYDACVENHLVVNAHGANKPTGENRTYPNVINREAVRGEEHQYNSYQTNVWVYTRNVVGPIDITPKIYTGQGTTTGQQAAMTIVFESGMPCMASTVEDYKSSPALPLLKDMPSRWDELFFLDGYPGDYTVLARRFGEQYYAGAITDETARDAVIDLSFLPEGKGYIAEIYRDGATKNDMIVESQAVTSEDTLTIPMAAHGGCSVKFVELDDSVKAIEMASEITVTEGESKQIEAAVIGDEDADTTLTWTVENESIATVDENGVLTAKGVGITTVTATSVVNSTVKATAIVLVPGEKYGPAEGWTIFNPATDPTKDPVFHGTNLNKVTLNTAHGDVGYSNDAENVWLMDAPEGDFTLTLKVTGLMSTNWQKVGVMAWADEANTVSTVRRFHNSLNNGTDSKNHFGMYSYNGGFQEPVVADTDPSAPAWIKLVKEGNTFKGFYSFDGETWTACGTITNEKVGSAADLKVGFYGVNGNKAYTSVPIEVEDFTVDGKIIPLAAATDETEAVLAVDPEGIEAEFGTAFADLSLPETVTAYFDNGTKGDAAVTWNEDSYDPNTAGVQTVTGTLAGGLTVTIEVTVAEEKPFVNPFTDVKEGDWYYDSVMWAVKNQITSGATETTFNYDGLSERCQVVTFLWRAAGEPEPETTENPFTDVNEGHYFYKAVLWAYEKGITQGISDTEFGPFAKCTRGQVVTFLHRVEGTPESSFVNSFEDVNETHYFYDAVLWASENGITVGVTETSFAPENQCKRSEIVTFLYRCMAE